MGTQRRILAALGLGRTESAPLQRHPYDGETERLAQQAAPLQGRCESGTDAKGGAGGIRGGGARLIGDSELDGGGGREAGAGERGLIDDGAVGPLRGGDIIDFAAEAGDVEAMLRVGFA